ncbi:site-specific DNA-methyltransferase, partial [Candidatus Parcubacteria bacterium]|nr:site-specific DNA-methyltransferase [Candidatus Parcubacteria bacterium]
KRTILDKTISAPFQEIRRFGESKEKSEIENEKQWYNKLIYGDNLQALKYLLDNGYKGQIKLIYIDPPFATKSDFSKGEVKAYRDKLEGAEFIEFVRERLILMKELLSNDGFIYVHLDEKKGHYIKIILDEIFTEANYRNDIIWTYNGKGLANAKNKFVPYNAYIYLYSKNPNSELNNRIEGVAKSVMGRFGRYLNKNNQITFKTLKENNEKSELEKATKRFISQFGKKPNDDDIATDYNRGVLLKNIWNDIGIIRANKKYKEFTEYPTQKPEKLLERIIKASSNENDLILDAFVGSATTCAVAEKLNRKWIGIDAGKLAIYTSQKRILDIKNHKPFIVMNSGVYEIRDIDKQVDIEDELYKNFACDLFQVDKNKAEKINGVEFSGKYSNNYVYVFSNKGKITRQDLEQLEKKLSGKLKRVYIIISQNQDKLYTNYLKIKNTQFYIHKIPYSLLVQFIIENRDSSQIIKHLRNNVILKANRGNLKNKTDEKAPEIDQKALEKINKISQVKKKSDIETKFSNIAGFDFVNTFEIEIEEDIKKTKDGVEIKIKSVKIGEKNGIENLSMILVDKDYNQKSFKVSQTFFAEDDTEEDEEGNKIKIDGFTKTKKIIVGKDGLGKEIAVIYMDDFGNELFKQFTI